MPSFELKHNDELKAWLVKELEPICDADPEVLSDYVLALLRHDATDGDLDSLLKEQLDDFLAEKTGAFVAKTMAALKSQSYLPSSKQSTSNQSISLPVEPSGSSSRKRSAEDEGRRSPAKAHRDEADESVRPPRGPSSSRQEGRADGQRGEGRRDRKPACRDFHLRGFCPRGDECRYDHTIPNPEFTMNPMMGMSMGQQGQQFPMMGIGNQQQQPYHMLPAQGGYPMGMQGPPGGWSQNGPESSSDQQGYLPEGTATNGADGGSDLLLRMGAQQPQGGAPGAPAGHDGSFRGGGVGGRGGRGGAAGRGGARGTFEKRPTSNTTLVIENVPAENLDLVAINEYFKKFGTITNIQIDVDSKKALVSYSQPGEAKAAHSSPEVIFNNRFVKVYFQRLDEPSISSKPKEAPVKPMPPLKNNFIPGQTSNKFVRADLPQSKGKELQEAAHRKLDGLMAEQKEIMAKLTSAGTPAEEKKTLMSKFGSLEGEIKAATEEVRNAVNAIQNKESSAPSSQDAEGATPKWKEQRESKQKEQLDRELEAHGKISSGTTTEELKAHLAKLQEEAAQLGIDPNAATSGRGGFRGRGRGGYRGGSGRGGYASYARGGATASAVNRASMSIDNRPTKLQVSEVAAGNSDKAKEYLKQFGEVVGIEDQPDGSFIIQYKARLSGERALRAGLNIPDVGQVKAAWSMDGTNPFDPSSAPPAGGENSAGADEGHEDDEGDRDDHFRR